MVRLMLTLTPCVCILAAIAISKTLETYLYSEPDNKSQKEKAVREEDNGDKSGDKKDKDMYKQVGRCLNCIS